MIPKLVRYVKVFREKFVMEDYRAEGQILALPESGSFLLEAESRTWHIAPMDCVLFQTGQIYHRRVLEPVVLHLFRYEAAESILPQTVLHFPELQRCRSDLELLERLNQAAPDGAMEHAAHCFADLVYLLRLEQKPSLSGGISDPMVAQALHWMEENYYQRLDLNDAAAKAGLSYVQFLRRFKAAAGTTPEAYIAALRQKRAEYLLLYTDLQIQQIARLCGFEDSFYFSNFFKKRTGVSPSSFRKELPGI